MLWITIFIVWLISFVTLVNFYKFSVAKFMEIDTNNNHLIWLFVDRKCNITVTPSLKVMVFVCVCLFFGVFLHM